MLIINEMGLKIIELPDSKAGKGYEFNDSRKNYTILETKANAYQGNHTHPYNRYTLLLRGKARYILHEDEREEYWLREGEIFLSKAGVPHILLPEKDTLAFEWWDGPFKATEVEGLFEDVLEERVR
jgi:quercetin dioxygenase-like cupin family protein